MKYVYIGNILSKRGENTYCPSCGKLLIERNRYTILNNELNNGTCGDCGTNIIGIWK